MLKGPGIHQIFGFKPIGKWTFAGVNLLTIDPVPTAFARKVLILFKVSQAGGTNTLNLKVNNAGVNHGYGLHYVGHNPGAVHLILEATNSIYMPISNALGDRKHGSILLTAFPTGLFVVGESFAWQDTTHYSSDQFGGAYVGAAPYTRLDFVSGGALLMTGNIQMFESVI